MSTSAQNRVDSSSAATASAACGLFMNSSTAAARSAAVNTGPRSAPPSGSRRARDLATGRYAMLLGDSFGLSSRPARSSGRSILASASARLICSDRSNSSLLPLMASMSLAASEDTPIAVATGIPARSTWTTMPCSPSP